jgi:type IV pilus assembly protein PilW
MTHLPWSRHRCARRDGGFSVVELMVAMAISLLLLGGVVTLFTSSKTTYERVERLSRIQETGRFALDAMMRDIRSAGYVGCARPSTFANTLNNSGALAWNFDNAILGYDFQSGTTWSPALDASMTATAASGATNGSDALVLRVPAAADTSATLRLTDKMASPTSTLSIAPVASTATAPVKVGDVVMLADCHARAVFEITDYTKTTGVIDHRAVAGTPGNATNDLAHAFEANSQLVPIRTVAYYIGTSGGRIGLWRISGSGAAEELVEGVERMELRFGEDTNGDRIADTYNSANGVGDWANVITVSLALLVRSPDEYGTERDAKTYTLLDQTFTAPNDRHVRQIFATTATLRNRAL